MSEQSSASPTPEDAIQKYKTVARAVAADDAPAARALLKVFEDQKKKLSSEEVEALGFRWLTMRKKEQKSLEMLEFLHELGFNFKQFVPMAGVRSASGNHIPFLLLENKNEVPLLEHAIAIGAIPANVRDTRGDTLLMDALDLGYLDLADRLLALGLSPDEQNLAGHTALHIFAGKVNFRAVNWLVTHGANPDIDDLMYSRAAQMVPESVGDDWDTDSLYNALEDFVEDFKAGRPFKGNPEFFEQLQREIAEDAKAQAQASEADASAPKPRTP
jgi:hypothetical protein